MSNLAQSKASEFGDVLASGLLMHCGRGLAPGNWEKLEAFCREMWQILMENWTESCVVAGVSFVC